MTNTVLSLVLLLFAALFFGKIAEYAKLPPLVGSLICGIIARNISCIDNFLVIVPAWDFTMRRLAMCNMIIRWAINIDVPYLQSNLRMQSIIPAACCFDNLMCVSVFCLTIGLTYSQEGSLAYTLHFCGQIFASTLAACALVMAGVDEAYCGIIGTLVFVCFATTRWRIDNPQKLPTWEPLWHALTFFGIGLIARLIGGLISTSCGEFRFKEQLLLTLAMMPKATVQIVIVKTPSDADDNASVTTYNRAEKIDDDANSMVTFKQFRSLYASQYDHPFNQKPYAIDRY
ncbi:hypothetical protein WR25_22981 [Diploscapter pachys]|uniref:Cation/H+ exchanger domain-containing protein n=1 Tax=Diploscapter pachys TaxID=2018661 RepID=A0A2A2JM16_9BILA|nr:hypothetical protein WR25_22981 [Diploscapter pachys]